MNPIGLLLIPLLTALLILLAGRPQQVRWIALAGAVLQLGAAILLYAAYINGDGTGGPMRLEYRADWYPDWNIGIHTGVDGISVAMILLTVPIFFPLIVHLGLDPIWFGVLIVCVVEIGMISPPVGMNIFVISSMLPDVPTSSIWRGVMPFLFADILRLALLIAFPAITLWLPKYLNL